MRFLWPFRRLDELECILFAGSMITQGLAQAQLMLDLRATSLLVLAAGRRWGAGGQKVVAGGQASRWQSTFHQARHPCVRTYKPYKCTSRLLATSHSAAWLCGFLHRQPCVQRFPSYQSHLPRPDSAVLHIHVLRTVSGLHLPIDLLLQRGPKNAGIQSQASAAQCPVVNSVTISVPSGAWISFPFKDKEKGV